MFLIFNDINECIGTSSMQPNEEDLKRHGESSVEVNDPVITAENAFNYVLKDGRLEKAGEKQISYKEAISRIENFRMTKENAPVFYAETFFQADNESIRRLTLAMIEGTEKDWADSGNELHRLSNEDIRNILSFISRRNQYIYKYCSEMKNVIRVAFEKNDMKMVEDTLNILEKGYSFGS